MAYFALMFQLTGVPVTLESMRRDLDAGIGEITWFQLIWPLVVAATGIFLGRVADSAGHLRIWYLGMSLSVVLSAAIALSPTAGAAIVGRGLLAMSLTLAATASVGIVSSATEASHRGRALGLWAAITMLGAVAGDLALTIGARGGVFIGGGIVPRFVRHLAGSAFRRHFEDKGRLQPYLARVPTHVILQQNPAFVGLMGLLADARAQGRTVAAR